MSRAENAAQIDAAIFIGCMAILIFFVIPEVARGLWRFL